ncbi:MAG: glycosyltransferase family 4 protein [Anaerolineae bacterium]|nr:glycosyltransferase family 4 protein [Anaerolineae bacterium]
MDRYRILFIIGYDPKSIGGVFISTISIAKGLQALGHQVGILLAPISIPINEFDNPNIRMHFVPYPKGKTAFFTRPFAINKIIRKGKYTHVITVDSYSALQTFYSAILNKLSIIQIIPGGTADIPPINLPGIIVFSEEIYEKIISKYKIQPDYILLSCGQVEFDSFSSKKKTDENSVLGFKEGYKKVLSISRLIGPKITAMMKLLDQVEIASRYYPIHCLLIGDGRDRPKLEQYCNRILKRNGDSLDIEFIGGFRVTSEHLSQADIIVGQGRTVIEGIACHIPSAVCGTNGYYGLLNSDNFSAMTSTNLTGRGLASYSDLVNDLEYLSEYKKNDMDKVYWLSFDRYDVKQGVNKVNALLSTLEPFKLNRFDLLFRYSKTLLQTIMIWVKEKLRKRI